MSSDSLTIIIIRRRFTVSIWLNGDWFLTEMPLVSMPWAHGLNFIPTRFLDLSSWFSSWAITSGELSMFCLALHADCSLCQLLNWTGWQWVETEPSFIRAISRNLIGTFTQLVHTVCYLFLYYLCRKWRIFFDQSEWTFITRPVALQTFNASILLWCPSGNDSLISHRPPWSKACSKYISESRH